MTTLIAGLAELTLRGPGQQVISKAKGFLSEILLPNTISGETVKKYIRKALRVGAWRKLKQEARALLIVLRGWGTVKSRILKSILYDIFLEIELHTTRGKALFYGIIISMKNSIHKLHRVIKNTSRLLFLGISYLNNPLLYRIYG